ncbi:unnamed protein product [Lota lota]
MMTSTAAGSTTSTPMISSTAAGSTTSTPMISSTAARSTVITTMMTSTTARSTVITAMMSSTAAATTVAKTTTATVPTNPPALTPNTTVEVLPTAISNKGCSSSQLCASQPESCNPSQPGSCFFVSTKQTAGQNFEFSLSGESKGYLGCTLSTDSTLGGNDTTYICANNNGSLKFIGALLNNGRLTTQTLPVNSVKGRIDGNRIQCTFAATIPNATARNTESTFTVAVVTGTFSNSELGPPKTELQTQKVELGNPNSNTTNTISASGRPKHQALSQALLIIIGTMGLAML